MNILDKLRQEGKLAYPNGTRVRFACSPTDIREGTIINAHQDYKRYEIVDDNDVYFNWWPFDQVCKIQPENEN